MGPRLLGPTLTIALPPAANAEAAAVDITASTAAPTSNRLTCDSAWVGPIGTWCIGNLLPLACTTLRSVSLDCDTLRCVLYFLLTWPTPVRNRIDAVNARS